MYRLIASLLLIGCINSVSQTVPYADWAHDHVIWLNAKEQNQSAMINLVKQYQDNGIPVGGVNIDSGWSTCYNNFQFDLTKFPDPKGLVDHFHAQGIKVILWATSLVNNDCDIYQQGLNKGYFLNKGQLVKWWHGHGAFVDFFNPKAKQWWFTLMDKALDLGFDGWKTDGSDPIIALLKPYPYSRSKFRPVGLHQYGHQYYGSFYNHTKSKNPNALIMSRPVDSLKNKFFYAYSPKYVMFSGWVGDQDSSAAGFVQAMVNVIHSASEGYLSFSFDIGGYRGQNISKNIYLRWMQTGALLPFMENGGNGKHQPWKFDEETVEIYRKFVILHMSLKTFFLTSCTEAYALKKSVMQPIYKDSRNVQFSHSSNLGYVLWNTFLVYPIFQENGLTELQFPKGYKWIYYFNQSKVYTNSTIKTFPLDQTPFFIRSNTITYIGEQLSLTMLQQNINKTYKFIHINRTQQIYVEYNIQKRSLAINVLRQNENQLRLNIPLRFIGLSKESISLLSNTTLNQMDNIQQNGYSLILPNPIFLEGIMFIK